MKRLNLSSVLLAAVVLSFAGAGETSHSAIAAPRMEADNVSTPAQEVAVSHASLAQVFTILTHDMECGASRRHLVRYEGPISVGLVGPGASAYGPFVDEFLAQLRGRSGIDMFRQSEAVNLHVRFVGSSCDRVAPGVWCLVAPGNVSWEQLAAAPSRHSGRALVQASSIEHMTIFIPQSAQPDRVRSCLLDDDAHLWPTALDYLMLRVLYSPHLRSGMGRDETERAARQVLDRIDPVGVSAPPMVIPQENRMASWRGRIHDSAIRATGAEGLLREALQIAKTQAPSSAYHCYNLIELAQVIGQSSPSRALDQLTDAERVCEDAHGARDIRLAWIGAHRATLLLRLGRHKDVLRATEELLPVFAAYGQDRQTSALYEMQKSAHPALGPRAPARYARQLAMAPNTVPGIEPIGVASVTVGESGRNAASDAGDKTRAFGQLR